MSVLNTHIAKQPLKLIEVPLNKFKEEVIPHHQKVFEQHRIHVLKLLAQANAPVARQEVKNKKRVIKQLKDLMYELDTLRAQVENSDLDKFDTKTLSLRKIIIELISGYTGLEKQLMSLESSQVEEAPRQQHPFEGASQIQLQENLEELKLKHQVEILHDVEKVQREAEDLNEIFTHLHGMVEEQGGDVDKAEEQIEGAQENIQGGLRQLIKAHKLKTAAYPATGALLGTMIGGPVGLVAGLKVGGLAALGCAIVGYTGGKFFKKTTEAEHVVEEVVTITAKEGEGETQEKKDI